MKGQSESHPSLSTTDEFAANYELWDLPQNEPIGRHDSLENWAFHRQ